MIKKILLAILVVAFFVASQAFAFNPLVACPGSPPAAPACTTTGPDIFVELAQAAYGGSWAMAGNDNWSVVTADRGSCSTKHWSISAMTAGDNLTHDFADSVTAYVDFWFKFTGGPDTDTESLRAFALQTDAASSCIYIEIVNNSGTLQVRPYYYDNGAAYGTFQTVVAGTWYHIGLFYDSTANTFAWYFSETDALGAAKDSASEMSTLRVPGIFVAGGIAKSGTFTGTLQVDSIGIDNDTMTAVEY